jgi:thioredoxin 1
MKIIPDWNAFETEVIKHAGTVLVDFYTDGCGPCRMMNPVLEEISGERADLKVVKVDAASNYETATKFRILAVPTFVLLQNGDVKGQFTGARSKRDLVTWIDANK